MAKRIKFHNLSLCYPPSSADFGFIVAREYILSRLLFLVTLVSLPAGSVPVGMTVDSLPVGIQIVAPRFEEPKILTIAKLVQGLNPIGFPQI